MKQPFLNQITQTFAGNPRAFFVTGDLGFNFLESFAAQFEKRFLNAGIAEQNMIGVSAGIAMEGFEPWVYSIIPFLVLRPLEQIRNDLCFHKLPVRLVGNGGGYSYGIAGSTHHALEDLGVLKGMPNLSLFFPGTDADVAPSIAKMNQLDHPSYLRLSNAAFRSERAPIARNEKTLTTQYHPGKRLTVIGIGHAIQSVLAGLDQSGESDWDVAVFGVNRFPFDFDSDRSLMESIAETGRVLVVEEHFRAGSVFESFLSAYCGMGKAQFELICPFYDRSHAYGSAKHHLEQCGMGPDRIVEKIRQMRAFAPN